MFSIFILIWERVAKRSSSRLVISLSAVRRKLLVTLGLFMLHICHSIFYLATYWTQNINKVPLYSLLVLQKEMKQRPHSSKFQRKIWIKNSSHILFDRFELEVSDVFSMWVPPYSLLLNENPSCVRCRYHWNMFKTGWFL